MGRAGKQGGEDGASEGGKGRQWRSAANPPGRAGQAREQRAAQRQGRRRQEGEAGPAGRPGCLIFCQPPLINGPPSSSRRAEPRSGSPARSFLAEAGPAERLHLHEVPRLRGPEGLRGGGDGGGRRASQAGREEEGCGVRRCLGNGKIPLGRPC